MNTIKSCWEILEIEPTTDKRKIKKAYAKKAKSTHPEDNESDFLALRSAYETAVKLAENEALILNPSLNNYGSKINKDSLSSTQRNGKEMQYDSLFEFPTPSPSQQNSRIDTTSSLNSSADYPKKSNLFFDTAFDLDDKITEEVDDFLYTFFKDLNKRDYRKINSLMRNPNFKTITNSEFLTMVLLRYIYSFLKRNRKIYPVSLKPILLELKSKWMGNDYIQDYIKLIQEMRNEHRGYYKVVLMKLFRLIKVIFGIFLTLFIIFELNLQRVIIFESELQYNLQTKVIKEISSRNSVYTNIELVDIIREYHPQLLESSFEVKSRFSLFEMELTVQVDDNLAMSTVFSEFSFENIIPSFYRVNFNSLFLIYNFEEHVTTDFTCLLIISDEETYRTGLLRESDCSRFELLGNRNKLNDLTENQEIIQLTEEIILFDYDFFENE